jgi:hypothetical protein
MIGVQDVNNDLEQPTVVGHPHTYATWSQAKSHHPTSIHQRTRCGRIGRPLAVRDLV